MTLPQDIKNRLDRSGISELKFEKICRNYTYLQLGVDPSTTNAEWDKQTGIPLSSDRVNPLFDPGEPVWKNQIYHMLTFMEMTLAVSQLQCEGQAVLD